MANWSCYMSVTVLQFNCAAIKCVYARTTATAIDHKRRVPMVTWQANNKTATLRNPVLHSAELTYSWNPLMTKDYVALQLQRW